jgi:hypothetical protein
LSVKLRAWRGRVCGENGDHHAHADNETLMEKRIDQSNSARCICCRAGRVDKSTFLQDS